MLTGFLGADRYDVDPVTKSCSESLFTASWWFGKDPDAVISIFEVEGKEDFLVNFR